MTWLLTQMWALLGAAALIALIFGWGLRGALLRGRLRRSEVEAGLARTELEQARTEIEGLYAAQRKLGDGGLADSRGEIEERDRTIETLSAEVSTLKSRLDSATDALKSKVPGGNEAALAAVVGAAGAGAGAFATGQLSGAGGADEDVAQARIDALEAEAAGLRSQVETLQGEIHNARTFGESPADAAAVLPGSGESDNVEMDKLVWQNNYLRTRLKVFEQRAGVQLSGEPPAGPEEVVEDVAESPVIAPIVSTVDDRETPDEELARLRWRNRYLEGRLAYLEEERSREVETAAIAAAVPAVGAVLQSASDAATDTASNLGNDSGHADAAVADTAMDMLTSDGPATPVETEADVANTAFDPAPVDTPVELPSEPVEPASEPVADMQPPEAGAPALDEPAEAAPGDIPPDVPLDTPAAPGDIGSGVTEVQSGVAPQRPVAMDEPADPAERDDLTRIEGIGPRIQDVLNSVGIYSFRQIAEWTQENETWIDDYLSFSGRVGQQDWVQQAARLAEEAQTEGEV